MKRIITIEFDEPLSGGYTVREGDRYHDQLCWDEMLGQIVHMTHCKINAPHYGMLNKREWAEWRWRWGGGVRPELSNLGPFDFQHLQLQAGVRD